MRKRKYQKKKEKIKENEQTTKDIEYERENSEIYETQIIIDEIVKLKNSKSILCKGKLILVREEKRGERIVEYTIKERYDEEKVRKK